MESPRCSNREGNDSQSVVHFGMLKLKHSGLTALDFFDIVDDNYGVDEEGLVPPEDDDEGVELPCNAIQLSEQQLTELTEAIDPLGDSDDYGISVYVRTVQCLESIIH